MLEHDFALGRDFCRDLLRVHFIHLQHLLEDAEQLRRERMPHRVAELHVELHDGAQRLGRLRGIQSGHVGARVAHDAAPRGVQLLDRKEEQLVLQPSSLEHGQRHADGLEKGPLLHLRQLRRDGRQVDEDEAQEHLRLAVLHAHKLGAALLADLEEGVARHVLHARVRLVHELEQLIHHRLEELPVRDQEARVLSHDVHDVGCDDSLVVLAARHLAHAQQVADESDQEALLVLLRHGAADGAHGPAQRVQRLPGPRASHLSAQLAQQDALHVVHVEVGEVHEDLAHLLVHGDHVRIRLRLADHVPRVLVLDHQHLLRLGHAVHQNVTQRVEVRLIHAQLLAHARSRPSKPRRCSELQDLRARLPHLAVLVARANHPVVEADLEHLLRWLHSRHADQIGHALLDRRCAGGVLLQAGLVILEQRRQIHGEPLHKVQLVLPV
mmetsp:Transcript_18783/g.59888  ORF Transcript_18783/g.59888 Transcript_18783/m.59888 type:complete len:439 (-) Transcript_18783:909-2225(-)